MRHQAFKSFFVIVLCFEILHLPVLSLAGPVQVPGFHGTVVPPPSNALPVLRYPGLLPPGVSRIETPASNQLFIYQNQPRAVIDWSSFNIGADAWTHFDQQDNSNWVALNRIWDRNPSYIFGRLTADGRIYLINQNGILFGPGSKVNVNTLIASALNMRNEDFLSDLFINKNRILRFQLEDYQGTGLNPLAIVSNHGEIQSRGGGSIFLIAPRTENAGKIVAPSGQVGLIAGSDVTLAHSHADDLSRSGYYVIINDDFHQPLHGDPTFGLAVNRQTGVMVADGGIGGIYGHQVEQHGIIRSVTAFKNKRGQVELRASGKITIGPESRITLPVDTSINPETGKPFTVDDTFDIQPIVDIRGLHRWSPLRSIIDIDPARKIEHYGLIEAPTGVVTLTALDRIYLEQGSRIDVSGLTIELPMPMISDFRLNTVELRDAYGQKDGILLGTKINTPVISGTAVGDYTQAILTRPRTAIERSIGGARRTMIDESTGVVTYNNAQTGRINLTSEGDIIVKQGAVLDLSGGGVLYKGGTYDSTKLLSGNRVYDISNAPLYLTYDKILGEFTKVHERFGIREKHTGIYYGGAVPIRSYIDSYWVGGDAGSLHLSAKSLVLDGLIDGSVRSGAFQNAWTMQGSFSGETAGSDYDLAVALSVHRGLETPRAGSVTIQTDREWSPSSITLRSEVPARSELKSDAPPLGPVTEISTHILNRANLLNLSLSANLTFTTEPDARIDLRPGGYFSANARRVEHQGGIVAPGGSIRLIARLNQTSERDTRGEHNPPDKVIPLQEGLFLGPRSLVDASGERVDRSLVRFTGLTSTGFSHTTGGSIAIKDQTDQGAGVLIPSGAVVDVSAGYFIDQKGKITGSHAGLIDLQGSTIQLDGNLRGYALSDSNGRLLGGSITIQSSDVQVVPSGQESSRGLVIAGDRFRDTGFTQIGLSAYNDVIIDEGANLVPSLMRLNQPIPRGQSNISLNIPGASANGQTSGGLPELFRLENNMAFMAGPSSISLTAGKEFEGFAPGFTGHLRPVPINSQASVSISPNSMVRTFPSVSGITRIANDVVSSPGAVRTGVSIRAPKVGIAGAIESSGGDIRVEATMGDLLVGQGGRIIARGYNRQDPGSTPKGFGLNHRPVSGGNVSLLAYADIVLAEGSLIDLSGSQTVVNRMRSELRSIHTYQEAGDPGSLSLAFGRDLIWSGDVNAHSSLNSVKGGTLTLQRRYFGQTQLPLAISTDDLSKYVNTGFDEIVLRSVSSIQFNGSISGDAGRIGRKLTLDAPEIRGTGSEVVLSAPWIALMNRTAPATGSPETGDGRLTLIGDWIDVMGAVQLSRFNEVTLKASQDIRLSEALYDNNLKRGRIVSAGDLTFDASRLYPSDYYVFRDGQFTPYLGAYSDFSIASAGKITFQNSGPNQAIDRLIYSAGGSLSIEGRRGVEFKSGSYVATPMGEIRVSAPGERIQLNEGSILSVRGANDSPIHYGLIIDNRLWMKDDKISIQNVTPVDANSLPQKRITLDGETIVFKEGATLDVSGGGSVFSYAFQPGIEGSIDPLTKSGRYIVFKDHSLPGPGSTITLQGGGGLAPGIYSLYPLDRRNPQNARYAFLPGAYILESKSVDTLPGPYTRTTEGYPLIAGYWGIADTPVLGTRPQIFTVRPTSDVLREGHYVLPDRLVSGQGGDIALQGRTALLAGLLKADPFRAEDSGGKIALTGTKVLVQPSSFLLPGGLTFSTPIPEELRGSLNVADKSLSGRGFSEVRLGDQVMTEQVVIQKDALLDAVQIALSARQDIKVESGATLKATSVNEQGILYFQSPSGLLTVEPGAMLHASHRIDLDVKKKKIEGDLRVDHSGLTIRGDRIFFVPEGYLEQEEGVYLTENLLRSFLNIGDLAFVSRSDIRFLRNFTGDSALAFKDILTFDSPRIASDATGNTSVTVRANTVNLKNTSQPSSAQASAGQGTFEIFAEKINLGEGHLLMDGFGKISFNSQKNVTLLGTGSFTTGDASLSIKAVQLTTDSVVRPSGFLSRPISPVQFVLYTGRNYLNEQNNPNPTQPISVLSHIEASQRPRPSPFPPPAFEGTPGGRIDLLASSIQIGGIVQMDGGTIAIQARGNRESDGILIQNHAFVMAKGTDVFPAGRVELMAENGPIVLSPLAIIDVSAGSRGDGGAVLLKAPKGGVTLDGRLLGTSSKGLKSSLILDTTTIQDMTALSQRLEQSGFSELIDIRTRIGDLIIPSSAILSGHRLRLTADGGNLNVFGTLDASWSDGSGRIELFAKNNLTTGNGAILKATGLEAGAKGGSILMSASEGRISLNAGSSDSLGSIIDLRGNRQAGGTLYLRAPRDGNDVSIDLNGARIIFPSAIYTEAVRVYNYNLAGGKTLTMTDIGASDTAGIRGDTKQYMTNNTAYQRLRQTLDGQGIGNTLIFMPGVEIRNTAGDLTLGTNWDFSQQSGGNFIWRYGTENDIPGVLTLRAKGNLNIANHLVDHPTPIEQLFVEIPVPSPSGGTGRPPSPFPIPTPKKPTSWAFNLVAGADISSANYLSVIPGSGNLIIQPSKVVYTENAPVRFASGLDTSIGLGFNAGYMIHSTMRYNLATYDGPITGYIGRDLILNGGAIQSALGDIKIETERDLQLNLNSGFIGAIRTTGQTSVTETNPDGLTIPNRSQYWTYKGGGDIHLTVGRHLGRWSVGKFEPALNVFAWDTFTRQTVTLPLQPGQTRPTQLFYGIFSASYEERTTTPKESPTAGIVTMGGGDLFVRTGGDFLSQAGTFGKGDLTLISGGNVDGRFLHRQGRGEILSAGNFGIFRGNPKERLQIELFDSQFSVNAQGEIQIATALNPDLASNKTRYKMEDDFVNCTYTERTSLKLRSGSDLYIAGESPIYTYTTGSDRNRATIFPASLDFEAKGDITFLKQLNMTSSPMGHLRLVAGGNIRGADPTTGKDQSHMILMSDIAPEYWYGLFQIYRTAEAGMTWFANRTGNDVVISNRHGFYKDPDKQGISRPLHTVLSGDSEEVRKIKQTPVTISAGEDIKNLKLYLPKKADIQAKRDILEIHYEGQNIHPEDVSKIRAGRNIAITYSRDISSPAASDQLEGMVQGGPGVFIVQAGNMIDLGTLRDGIQTIGNGRYPRLGTDRSRLVIISGYGLNRTADEIEAFFVKLQQAGDEYAELSAQGKLNEAEQFLKEIREETIYPFLGMPTGKGDIYMTASQVATSIGQSDIMIIASGDLNLGKTALPVSGKVSKKTGITTGGGGAISIFARGDVNVNESRIMTFYGGDITIWSDEGNINAGRGSRTAVSASPPKTLDDGTRVFTPPAIGSGIRAVTYGENAPEPGNIHLFAPTGIIDAGEAEIAGGKIVIAATEVLNVQNISFTMGSVGFSIETPSQAMTGLAGLTGTSGLVETTKVVEQQTMAVTSVPQAAPAKPLDEFIRRWVEVEILGFE